VHPVLPNFLIGEILLDPICEKTGGAERIRTRIQSRVGVKPHGILAPATTNLLYRHSAHLFGRHSAIVCPFLDREYGACTIWRQRNATCATWHCKHERGARGYARWRLLHALLTTIERDLATWCLREGDLDVSSLADAFPPLILNGDEGRLGASDLDATVCELLWRQTWGRWADDPEAWYIACAERVRALDAEGLRAAVGPEVLPRAKLVAMATEELSSPMPDAMRAGPCQVMPLEAGMLQVVTYSEHDPLELPAEVFGVLARFDGRPTRAVLAELEGEGVELHEDILRTLLDYRALVPA
jgi:hypothetical protein